jgi:hypothetical protein
VHKLFWHLAETALGAYVIATATKKVAPDVYDGVRDGSREALADLLGYAMVGQADLDDRRLKVLKQSREYSQRCQASSARRDDGLPNREQLLATTFLGGDSLATYIREGQVPDEIGRAYALQYPELAAHHSLVDELHRLDSNQILGLVAGVKGKLFELRYLDYLNDGHLPDGYHAALADSANQPGWDILVTGPNHHVADMIQLKATESVGYVQHALYAYPHIDVVTTSEVYSHLAMLGAAQHVADGGITDAALTSAVSHGFDASHIHAHWGPPVLALAIAAWSSYKRDDLDRYEKSKLAGESGTRSWLAYLAGGTLAVATQTWWLAIAGSVGARLVLDKGKFNRAELARLDEQIETNQRVLAKFAMAS